MARKAVLKRIKITKTGRVLHRPAGLDHFNAKSSRASQIKRKRMAGFYKTTAKKLMQYCATR